MMIKKNVVFLLISTFIFALVASASYLSYQKNESNIIQSNITEKVITEIQGQFEIYIDELISGGIVTSEYFSQKQATNKNYEHTVGSTIGNLKSIYGINLLNADGKIIRVYPYQTNQKSLGKVTQNIAALNESYQRKEEYWFSPPFDLYQGLRGFAIYIPIKKNGDLLGWVAAVISIKSFFENVSSLPFLQDYHLIIKDEQTSLNYFKSNFLKMPSKVTTEEKYIRGRKIDFISWPRSTLLTMNIALVSLSFSLLVAFIITYLYALAENKQKNTLSLAKVQDMLNYSLQDASSITLIQLNQIEILKSAPEYISTDKIKQLAQYLFTLFNQINCLKKIIDEEDTRSLLKYPLLPLLTEIKDDTKAKFEEKDITLNINTINFAGKNVMAHLWLLQHSVLENVFNTIYEKSAPGSTISINWQENDGLGRIIIHNEYSSTSFSKPEESIDERAIVTAKKIMQIMFGDIQVKSNAAGELSYEIIFSLQD